MFNLGSKLKANDVMLPDEHGPIMKRLHALDYTHDELANVVLAIMISTTVELTASKLLSLLELIWIDWVFFSTNNYAELAFGLWTRQTYSHGVERAWKVSRTGRLCLWGIAYVNLPAWFFALEFMLLPTGIDPLFKGVFRKIGKTIWSNHSAYVLFLIQALHKRTQS